MACQSQINNTKAKTDSTKDGAKQIQNFFMTEGFQTLVGLREQSNVHSLIVAILSWHPEHEEANVLYEH